MTVTATELEISKYKEKRDKIRTKTLFITGAAGLIRLAIDNIENLIRKEIEETKEKNESLTFFQLNLLDTLEELRSIILTLYGIEQESDIIDTELAQICFFIEEKTGIKLN